jgi:purine nucleoside permease
MLAALLVAVSFPSARAGDRAERGHRRQVKVMIISTFGSEGQVWLDRLEPRRAIRVPGLAPDYPDVHCNQSEVCVVTTGMGHSNAAASVTALVFSRLFDLSLTYFIVTGVAGIDPAQGTLGSAAWARYLVEFGLQWEIDAREIPPDWTTGYLGIDTTGPTQKPPLEYGTEVFQLSEVLLGKAYALSRDVPLADSAQAQATRAKIQLCAGEPAAERPAVRHRVGRYLVRGYAAYPAGARLDEDLD